MSPSPRTTAALAGVFYLLTFASSIPAVFLIAPIVDDPAGYVTGPGADGQVLTGALLDMINAFTAIATAVVLYPLIKRQQHALALGFVTSRVIEAAIIATGVVSLLAAVTLRQEPPAGIDDATLGAIGQALITVRDWTFLVGPGIMAVLNALMFGTIMVRSGLVPRWIPTVGLVGAPMLLASNLATAAGINELGTVWSSVGVAGIFVWELSVGAYMAFRGFRPAAVEALLARTEDAVAVAR